MDASNTIRSLIEESRLNERAGNIALAIEQACQALHLAQENEEPQLSAAAFLSLGWIRFRQGRYQAARELAEKVLSLLGPGSRPDMITTADTLLLLGVCSAETASLDEAENYFLQAANQSKECGDPLLRMRALHNLGSGVYLVRGRFHLALAADQEAYQIAREAGLNDWIHFPLMTIAWNHLFTGQRQKAHLALDELRQTRLVKMEGSAPQGYHSFLSGELALMEGDDPAALTFLLQAFSIAEAASDPGLYTETRISLGRYYRMNSNYAAACEWTEAAASYAGQIGYEHGRGKALVEHGYAAWLAGNLSTAERDFVQAADIFVALEDAFNQARDNLLLAGLQSQTGNPLAPATFQQAIGQITDGGYEFLIETERLLVFSLFTGFIKSQPFLANTFSTLLEKLQTVPCEPWRIHTLGGLQIRLGRRKIDKRDLRQRRIGELLSLLLTSPNCTLNLEQITEALCPEKTPAAAQAFIHHATSELRRILEPELTDRRFRSRYLDVDEGQIALQLPLDSWIDYVAFRSHCRQKRWQEAIELYKGEFLPEYRYADWAAPVRESLSLEYQSALLELSRKNLEHNEYTEALNLARQALAIDPWNERATSLGMQACIALKDIPGAIRLYRALEKTLREELGIPPQEEVQALFLKISQTGTSFS